MKKSEKTLLITAILTILSLALILFIYLKYMNREDAPVFGEPKQNTYTTDSFQLDTKYEGDSNWTYTITGKLPNACYEASSNAIVMESYPEQVSINLQVEEVGDICAQVIQQLNETGTFQASQEAQVSFNVTSD